MTRLSMRILMIIKDAGHTAEYIMTSKALEAQKQWKKKAKREKKLAERRAKRQAKFGNKKEEENLNKIKVDEPLSLDFITNPDKGK